MWILPKNLRIFPSVQDTGALISDSQELSEQLAQSVLWRSKPSSSKTWSRRLKRDCSTPRLFSQILKPSLGNSIMEKWTSSVEASLANHLVPQEDVKEAKTQDTCGLTSQTESSAWEDLPLFSLKTSRESSPQNSRETIGQIPKERLFCTMSLKSWNAWVTERRREYSVRVKLAHRTKESACLFLVSEMTSETQGAQLFQGCSKEGEVKIWNTPSLPNQVQPTPPQEAQHSTHGSQEGLQWATPNTMDCLPLRSEEANWATPAQADHKMYHMSIEAMRVRLNTKRQLGLPGHVHQTEQENWRQSVSIDRKGHCPKAPQEQKEVNWATPMAGTKDHMGSSLEYYQRRTQIGKQVDLNGQVMLEKDWTTPISRDCYEIAMNHQIPIRKDGKTRLDTMPRQVHHQEGYKGKLNPRWVETLMGLPVGWTMPNCQSPVIIEQMSYDYLGTELFPPQQNEHLEPYGEPCTNNQVRDIAQPTEEPWPTPNARDFKDSISTVPPSVTVTRGYSLGQAVAKENIKDWPTPSASQRGDTLETYERRSRKREEQGLMPFAPVLQVAVEASEKSKK